jgi:hypothetical protein
VYLAMCGNVMASNCGSLYGAVWQGGSEEVTVAVCMERCGKVAVSIWTKGVGTVCPVHTTNTYRGSRGMAPLSFNTDTGWL